MLHPASYTPNFTDALKIKTTHQHAENANMVKVSLHVHSMFAVNMRVVSIFYR